MGRRLTDQERADRAMSEAAFQRRVFYRAKKWGWRWMHVSPAIVGATADGEAIYGTPTAKGFPDALFVKAGRKPIFAELKRELGIVTPEQWQWLDLLIGADQCAVVWRPSDLPDIEKVFAG